MRGRRRANHGESSQQVDHVLGHELFTIDEEVSRLTRLRSEPCQKTCRAICAGQQRPISTFKMLSARETNCSGIGRFSSADCSYTLQKHLPAKGPGCVDDMDSEAYVSQFSSDGSLLVCGFRGSRIKIYDVEKRWKVHKDIRCRSLRWTVSDIALSPDQQYLVYASLSPIVHIVNVQNAVKESHANITEIHEGLEFFDDDEESNFGIFSVKFSKDGRDIVVGNNNESIYVYDLGANKVSVCIRAHAADVNVVTFADESGNILYSGSDDSLCKVWDRRCLTRKKPAGVLPGHLDGITFIDSRGDGRYLISNCKDQTIKLWDIRKMSSTMKGCTPQTYYNWDYRCMPYPSKARHLRHRYDQSLATFRGHSVLRTLIRCYFSPAHSTGQRYIYTGSSDQCVYIYDLVTGNIVEKLAWHGSIIRDCTWHPYHPTLVSSSWDGYVARWEASWDDRDPKMERGMQRAHPDGYVFSFI